MSKLLVVLDPGHFPKYNKGAVKGYYEGDRMFDLTLYEKEALQSYGIDVKITRNRTQNKSLYARGRVAVKNSKNYENVVFISNHSNACNGKACGVEAYRSIELPKSETLGKKLVEAIVDVMKPTKVTYNRGVKTRKGSNGDYYGVIRNSLGGNVNYSFIIEHGFHDNLKECEFLNNPTNLKKIAEAKAKVIADYFGLNNNVPFLVQVKRKDLNIRKGPGVDFAKVKYIKPGCYTIITTKKGKGSTKGWGKLKSGVGWVSLDYVEKAQK